MHTTVIFDMDGLLIDTEPYWVKVMMDVFSSVGVHLTPEECAHTTGLRFDQVVQHWYSMKPWKGAAPDVIHERVLARMEHIIREEAPLKEGAQECIHFFREKGYKTAVASSSALRLIQACTTRFHPDSFDIIHSAEFESHGKPHPAVFLTAAEKLKATPAECLVLEDSFNGILAAKAARMTCIAVPEPKHFDTYNHPLCDYKVKSLLDVPGLGIFQPNT